MSRALCLYYVNHRFELIFFLSQLAWIIWYVVWKCLGWAPLFAWSDETAQMMFSRRFWLVNTTACVIVARVRMWGWDATESSRQCTFDVFHNLIAFSFNRIYFYLTILSIALRTNSQSNALIFVILYDA